MSFTEKVLKNINVKSVVHIGAHLGQEVLFYKQHGVDEIYLFEPQKQFYNELLKKFNSDKSIKIHNFAIGSKKQLSKIYISSNDGASSSLLPPKEHLNFYPDIVFSNEEIVKVEKLSNFKISNFDLMVVDTQGYELDVLKGSGDFLEKFNYLILEINLRELYQDNPTVTDLDEYLSKYGFLRVKTTIHSKKYFGDALYAKASKYNRLRVALLKIKSDIFVSNFCIFLINLIHLDLWKDKLNNLKKS
tara:strand:- start:33 stop:770 length:738 start_codon:yes stop_codon:yes gene_type:complete